jgi:tRNA isopentenyl-2-thiomethyl-A-37 hydroxylase MiaE
VSMTWEHFRKEEGERPLLESVTRRLVKIVIEEASAFVTVDCKVQSRIVSKRPINPITYSKSVYSHVIHT